jgi:hypothetical protein
MLKEKKKEKAQEARTTRTSNLTKGSGNQKGKEEKPSNYTKELNHDSKRGTSLTLILCNSNKASEEI